MSVSLITSPFLWSWAHSRNAFTFICHYAQSVGSPSFANFAIDTDTFEAHRAGTFVAVVEIDSQRYLFPSVAVLSDQGSPSSDPWKFSSAQQLASNIASCYYISQIFDVTTSSTSGGLLGIAFNSVRREAHTIDLYFESMAGQRLQDSSFGLNRGTVRLGTNPENLPNYSLAVAIDVLANNCNAVTQSSSDWMFFQPDADGNVSVPLDILRSHFFQPDLPAPAEPAGPVLLTNFFLKYRIRYAEFYGSEPLLQTVTATPWLYAFDGEVADYYSRLNLPDWICGAQQVQFSSNDSTRFFVLGEDQGSTADVRRSQPEFLTLFYYDTSKAINATATLRLSLSVIDADGQTSSSILSYTVRNGNVYRFNVGPAALSLSSAVSYTLSIVPYISPNANVSPSFVRTYRVIPDLYRQHTFLLQNKWGCLNTFIAESLSAAFVTEGDSLAVRHRHYVGLNRRYQSFTVTSPALRRAEALRLSRSLASSYQYYLHSNAWFRIAIDPDSVTFIDETEDMVSLQFSFRFVEDQVDNLPSNTVRSTSNQAVVQANILDDANAYVSFDTRTTATFNAIHN